MRDVLRVDEYEAEQQAERWLRIIRSSGNPELIIELNKAKLENVLMDYFEMKHRLRGLEK